jgi:hypothetical protein
VADIGQSEAGSEVVALGGDQSNSKFWISIQFAVSQSKLLHHVNRCRISCPWAVQSYSENLSVAAYNRDPESSPNT